MSIGTYIKQLRISRGLSQKELGDIVGVQRAAVQKWECGRTQNLKRTTIQKLANFFEVSPLSFIIEDSVETDISSEQHASEDYLHSVITEAKKGGKTPVSIMGSEGHNMSITVDNKEEYELVTSILKTIRKSKEKDSDE